MVRLIIKLLALGENISVSKTVLFLLLNKLKKFSLLRIIQIPKNSYITPECKDLIKSLLKHNPSERITFDQFFAHEFLDLDHAPTRENYDKAVTLVQKAVQMDKEKNLKEAFHLYCEALRFFIPLLTSMTCRLF